MTQQTYIRMTKYADLKVLLKGSDVSHVIELPSNSAVFSLTVPP